MALPTRSTSAITAIAKSQQDFTLPQFVIGGRNASTYKLNKISTTYSYNVWSSGVYRVGKPFDIIEIRLNIYPTLAANMTIIPVLYLDNGSSTSTGTTINSTNYTGNHVRLTCKDFSNTVRGNQDFYLQLRWEGTVLATVGLPIEIDLEVYDV